MAKGKVSNFSGNNQTAVSPTKKYDRRERLSVSVCFKIVIHQSCIQIEIFEHSRVKHILSRSTIFGVLTFWRVIFQAELCLSVDGHWNFVEDYIPTWNAAFHCKIIKKHVLVGTWF